MNNEICNIEPVVGKTIKSVINGLILHIVEIKDLKTKGGMQPFVILKDEVGRETPMSVQFFKRQFSFNFEEVR